MKFSKLLQLYLLLIVITLFPESGICERLFEETGQLKAVLSAPISQAYAQKRKNERLYQDGMWSYNDLDNTSHRINVKIRTRGRFRRINCSLPPLQLNFQKKQVAGTLFDGQNKLKLVGPCRGSKKAEQHLVLEYLAYKSFELVSDYHFRTRLLELSYIDTDQKKKPWKHLVFLIENEKSMADRLGYSLFKDVNASRYKFDMSNTTVMELFQLMIGNTDYSTLRSAEGAVCCHNTQIVETDSQTASLIPVPYDFDSSGLVNASYAKPPDHIPIESVRKRYFNGWCKEKQHYQNAVNKFREQESEILELFEKSSLLDDRTRKSTLTYLQKFFTLINSPKRVEREIIKRCRGNVIPG